MRTKFFPVCLALLFLLCACSPSKSLPYCTGKPDDVPGKNCQLKFSQAEPEKK